MIDIVIGDPMLMGIPLEHGTSMLHTTDVVCLPLSEDPQITLRESRTIAT